MTMTERVDCVVIGAGVVGLACAAALAADGRDVIVLEREDMIGQGTSSRNSEVIHAGIYYAPGSLKAQLCRLGRDLLYRRCEESGIPFQRTGKLIVASTSEQVAKLEQVLAAAQANGVTDLTWLDRSDIGRLEPAVAAVRGLFSPSTGIVDSHALMQSLEGELQAYGGIVALRARIVSGRVGEDGITLDIAGDEPLRLQPRLTVNSAGLDACAVLQSLIGMQPAAIPTPRFAIGHYYALSGKSPCTHLVYPVPEEGGLGIHLTLDLAGQARFGPDVRWIDEIDYRFDDSRRDEFASAIRSYLPGIDESKLAPAYTGIRPKLETPAGLYPDFRILGPQDHGVAGLINLLGIESPGLTSSLAIGAHVRNLARLMSQ